MTEREALKIWEASKGLVEIECEPKIGEAIVIAFNALQDHLPKIKYNWQPNFAYGMYCGEKMWICPDCNKQADSQFDYCPNCGKIRIEEVKE